MPATQAEPPLLEIGGGVATITLRRPASHNRIEPDDLAVLRGYLRELDDTPAVKIIVFAGVGKTFSSGFDLSQLGKAAATQGAENTFEAFTDEIENARAVTIAKLSGPVYGGATDLALACDFRLGAEGIRMFMPAAKLGLHYYGHGIRRWVTRLGLGAAKRLFLTARPIDAAEMLRIGYLDSLVPAAELDAELARWIGELDSVAPVPLVSMKSILNATARQQYDEAEAQAAHRQSLASSDIREALAAFAEKRAPVFTGR
ncbi:MAG: enoyl-CoA hydratase/isomerase family protein [Pseudomonadota bacterium]|nr:enoyl-CoA hydratase/isomerase family protein [Pseudomonadota bacterium]